MPAGTTVAGAPLARQRAAGGVGDLVTPGLGRRLIVAPASWPPGKLAVPKLAACPESGGDQP
jgi:hypothetical protein